MGRPAVETYLGRSQFIIRRDHNTSWRVLSLSDATTGKLAKCSLGVLEFDFGAVHRTSIKHHAADGLSHSPLTGMNKSLLEDDVQVFMTTRTQREGAKPEMGTKLWHIFPCKDGMDTVKPGTTVLL